MGSTNGTPTDRYAHVPCCLVIVAVELIGPQVAPIPRPACLCGRHQYRTRLAPLVADQGEAVQLTHSGVDCPTAGQERVSPGDAPVVCQRTKQWIGAVKEMQEVPVRGLEIGKPANEVGPAQVEAAVLDVNVIIRESVLRMNASGVNVAAVTRND